MNLSYRHYYWRWLKNLIFLFLFSLILMTFARAAFALFFGEFSTLVAYSKDVKRAFFLGLRYDLMPLAYINALPFIILNLAYLLPGKFTIRVVRFLMINLVSLGYFLVVWMYICDFGFYSYYQEHINVLFFGLFEDDTKAVLISIWKNYHLLIWLCALAVVHIGIFKLVKFCFSPFEFNLRAKKWDFKVPLVLVTGLVVLTFLARGNFTRLPLSVEDAFISENEFINEIALNGALTLNRAIKIRKIFGKDQFDYLKNYGLTTWQDAFAKVRGYEPKSKLIQAALKDKTPFNASLEARPAHVVLVVMESFGSYWNNYNSEDFQILGTLKHHFDKGILFKNFLSAENGTIGSTVSIANSQVIRPGARFLSESEYMHTPLTSSGHLPYKEKGYETHFIYGGKLGWRDLGKYLGVQKYDNLWGADEIKESMPELNNFSSKDLGNEWGIFDEYLYSFIEEQLRTATKPQFFFVLTTSNHPPFEYPSSYAPGPLHFPKEISKKLTVDTKLARKRFLGLQYANQKIGDFLDRVKSSPLKDDVVIALTGDHSFWVAKGVDQEEEFRRYAVPFFISLPDRMKPAKVDLNNFGSHEDIFPTLFHLTLSNQSYIKLGDNLLQDNSVAINSSGLFANKKGAYHHGKYWKWKSQKDLILEPATETKELRALKNHALGLIGLTDSYLKEEKQSKQTAGENDRP